MCKSVDHVGSQRWHQRCSKVVGHQVGARLLKQIPICHLCYNKYPYVTSVKQIPMCRPLFPRPSHGLTPKSQPLITFTDVQDLGPEVTLTPCHPSPASGCTLPTPHFQSPHLHIEALMLKGAECAEKYTPSYLVCRTWTLRGPSWLPLLTPWERRPSCWPWCHAQQAGWRCRSWQHRWAVHQAVHQAVKIICYCLLGGAGRRAWGRWAVGYKHSDLWHESPA